MRSVILAAGISLDGYIARPDGAVDFLFMPRDYSMAPFFSTVDTAILGRKTYDVSLKLGASFGGSMQHYVLSRSKTPGKRHGAIFTNRPVSELVSEIRRRPGKNIWLMGGGEVAREFLKKDLVDEIHLGIIPVVIGKGIPLFPSGFPQREFKLLKNETFSRGLVVLMYKRVRSKTRRKS